MRAEEEQRVGVGVMGQRERSKRPTCRASQDHPSSSSNPTSVLIDQFIQTLQKDSNFPTSSKPISNKQSSNRRPSSPLSVSPPSTLSPSTSQPSIPSASPTFSPARQSFNSNSFKRASHQRQSLASSISSNRSSTSTDSIRSKRISQPVFLGATNGVLPSTSGEQEFSNSKFSKNQVLNPTREEEEEEGKEDVPKAKVFSFTHRPLPNLLASSTITSPTRAPPTDRSLQTSTPEKPRLSDLTGSKQYPPTAKRPLEREDSLSPSNPLRSKFSVSPDTRSKGGRGRSEKGKERNHSQRLIQRKNHGGSGHGQAGENETNDRTMAEGARGAGLMSSFSKSVKASVDLPRSSLSRSTRDEGGAEDERFTRDVGGSISPLPVTIKENSSTMGVGIQSLKSRINNKTPLKLRFGGGGGGKSSHPRSFSASTENAVHSNDEDSDWFASRSTIRQDSKSEIDALPPLPDLSLPKPSFAFGLVGSVPSSTSISSNFQSKVPMKSVQLDAGKSHPPTNHSRSPAVDFPSTSPDSPIIDRQNTGRASKISSVSAREKRKVSIGPQVAPSEWKSQLRKDQDKKEGQEKHTTLATGSMSSSSTPIDETHSFPSRIRGPSVSTVAGSSHGSSNSTSNQPFANARALLRSTRSNLSLGRSTFQRIHPKNSNLNHSSSKENIRDSWIDLENETAFMRNSQTGDRSNLDLLTVEHECLNGNQKENQNDGKGEAQTGWWASLKLKKQKSFAGIGVKGPKGSSNLSRAVNFRPSIDAPSPKKVQRTSRSQTVSHGVPRSQDSLKLEAGSQALDLKIRKSRPPLPTFDNFPSSTLNLPSPSPSKKRSREPETSHLVLQSSKSADPESLPESRAAVRGRDGENFRPRPWLRPLKLQSSRSSANLSSSSIRTIAPDLKSNPSLPNLKELPAQVISTSSPVNKYPPSSFNFSYHPPSLLVPPRSARSRASTVSSDDSEFKPSFSKSSSMNRSGSVNSEKEKDSTMRSNLTVSSLILFNDIHGEENREEALWKEREKARLNKLKTANVKSLREEENPTSPFGTDHRPQLPLRSQSALSFNRCTSPAPTPPPSEPLPLLPLQSSRLREMKAPVNPAGDQLNAPGGALGFFDTFNFASDVEEPDRSFSPASTTFGTSRTSRIRGSQKSSKRRYAGDWDEANQSFSPSDSSPCRSRSSPDLRARMEEDRPDSAATWREASEATEVLSSLITRFEGSSRSPASSLGLPNYNGTGTPRSALLTSGTQSRLTSRNSTPLRQARNRNSIHTYSPAPTISLTPEKWQHEEYSRRERDERRASGLTTGASIMTYESTERSDSSESDYGDQDDLESLIEGVVGSDSELPQESQEEAQKEAIANASTKLSSANLLSVQGALEHRSGRGSRNGSRNSDSSMGMSSETGSAYSGFNWQPPHILVQPILPNRGGSPIFDSVGQSSLPMSQPSTSREGGNSSLESPVMIRPSGNHQRNIGQESDSEFSSQSSVSESSSSSSEEEEEELSNRNGRLQVDRDEMSCVSSIMDESPCPPPRRRRSRDRDEVMEVAKSLNRVLGQDQSVADSQSSRQPLQSLSINNRTPFVGLVGLPSNCSAWQSVLKGPRGGKSTTPKSLFKDHLSKTLPPSPPSSTDKAMAGSFGSTLTTNSHLGSLDTQTPPATVRILAPAFDDENSPFPKSSRIQRNSFFEAIEKEAPASSVSPEPSPGRGSPPKIILTSESNEGHQEVDRPLSMGDSSFGEEYEEDVEVEIKTARITSVARASTLFGRSQDEIFKSASGPGVLIETVQESSWEEAGDGEQVLEEFEAEVSTGRHTSHRDDDQPEKISDSPVQPPGSFFSPDSSLDSMPVDSAEFSDISNEEEDSYFFQSRDPSNAAFESTMLTSPEVSRFRTDEIEDKNSYRFNQGDESWETIEDSPVPFDLEEGLELLIENRNRFPDTEFSEYMLSVFKPPRTITDAAMFLLDSRALCRPLETGIKLTAQRLTDRDYLDSPTRWKSLSPEAEIFLRTGSGAGERIRDYSSNQRPSTPTTPSPNPFRHDGSEEMGMRHYSSLSSMASEEAHDDFDVISEEEEEEEEEERQAAFGGEPLVYRYEPPRQNPDLPSLTGMLFQNQSPSNSRPNHARRFISHQNHLSNSSAASSLLSEEDDRLSNGNPHSRPPLIFLQSPTTVVSPSSSSSN